MLTISKSLWRSFNPNDQYLAIFGTASVRLSSFVMVTTAAFYEPFEIGVLTLLERFGYTVPAVISGDVIIGRSQDTITKYAGAVVEYNKRLDWLLPGLYTTDGVTLRLQYSKEFADLEEAQEWMNSQFYSSRH